MRMYQDERRLNFPLLDRKIKRKREAKSWTQEYLAQLIERIPHSIMEKKNWFKSIRYAFTVFESSSFL